MADDTATLLAKVRDRLPYGVNVIGGSDLSRPQEASNFGYKHKVVWIYPDKTIHEVTIEWLPDGGFEILNGTHVGKAY